MKDRIRVNGVLYEAIDSSKDIPSYRSMLGDMTHTDGKELWIFYDGLNQGYLDTHVSFNNRRTNKTPLSINLNEISSPIDGYAVSLRKGGPSYRSIKPFASKIFTDKNEAIKLFDKILDYAFSNFDIDNSRIGVRQINKMASAIVSKFKLEGTQYLRA